MLPPQALAELKKAVQSWAAQEKNLTDEIQRAQRAGIDVSSLQQRKAQLDETIRKIKLQYPEVNN